MFTGKMSTFLFRKGHPSGAPAGMPWDAPRPIHIIEHEDGPKSTECGPNIEDPFAPKKNLGSGDWDWDTDLLGSGVFWVKMLSEVTRFFVVCCWLRFFLSD